MSAQRKLFPDIIQRKHLNGRRWHILNARAVPLKTEKHCPIALNLWDILDRFKAVASFERTRVTVITEERTFQKKTDIQTGLGSLVGLIMATSGCPSLNFFKPMARFHLPFASTEETVFRHFGSFLIGEYLRGDISKEGITKELFRRYETINAINGHLLERIKPLTGAGSSGDADQNAIIILDTFATILSIQLADNITLLSHLYEDKPAQTEQESG